MIQSTQSNGLPKACPVISRVRSSFFGPNLFIVSLTDPRGPLAWQFDLNYSMRSLGGLTSGPGGVRGF